MYDPRQVPMAIATRQLYWVTSFSPLGVNINTTAQAQQRKTTMGRWMGIGMRCSRGRQGACPNQTACRFFGFRVRGDPIP
jgi:hypothetical protein